MSFCLWTMESCRKEKLRLTPLSIKVPSYFPATSFFKTNSISSEGFELGRRLFYDSQLSKDGSISCASCHQQVAAFGTYDHDLSHGINGEHGIRNAMSIFNIAWQSSFGWDGKANNLETIYAAHINSNIEMGETITNVLVKLRNDSRYPQQFKAAFGSTEINQQRLFNALTQFVGAMVSASSKYDSVKQTLATFTTSEQTGYTVFKNKCNSCHTEPLFTDFSYRNIGLPLTYLNDKGRMIVTGNKNDSLKFRVPTLRNLFKSFPFMHDGRFVNFDQIFNHYQTGVQQSATLDPLLINGISMTLSERTSLVDFLKTLTDYKLTTDLKFAAPQ